MYPSLPILSIHMHTDTPPFPSSEEMSQFQNIVSALSQDTNAPNKFCKNSAVLEILCL